MVFEIIKILFRPEIKFKGFRKLAREYFGDGKISFELKYEHQFFPAMADYCIDNPHSLLLIVRHNENFWEKLVKRDHSKEMTCYPKIPLPVLV